MSTMIELTSRSEKALCRRYKKELWTLRDLAKTYEMSVTTVLRILRDNRVKIRPRGRVPA